MKCACRDEKCPKQIGIDTDSGLILIEDNDKMLSVYLDPNLAVFLIKQLREYLLAAGNK